MSSLGTVKKKANTSIKWKIFLFLLGFCFLLLIILWLFQTVFLESFYTSIKTSDVEKQVNSLAELYQNADMDAFEETIQQRGDLFVELIDEQGESETLENFFSEFGMRSLGKQQRIDLYNQAKNNSGVVNFTYNETAPEPPDGKIAEQTDQTQSQIKENQENAQVDQKDNKMNGSVPNKNIVCGRMVTSSTGEEYLLLVRASVTPVNATVQTLRVQLVYISVIMIVLAVLIALLLSWWVAHPLQKLNKAAAELGEGNYDVSFDANGYKEVDELSHTLSITAKELAKTENLRRDLIANVSHDLRTPLTLITGYAEMIRDIPGENSPENMQVIIDEAKRLSSLVAELLDLSQLEAGVGMLTLQEFNITKELSDIVERFSKFSEVEQYKIVFENKSDKNAYVYGDTNRLSQVIYNFLTNAITHSEIGSTIKAIQTIENNRVKIAVQDEGEGILKEEIPYIWHRYYKVDKEHKRPVTGAGLGLSIVKNILEQHPNIEYGVESEEGEGSTFWFSLPIQKSE